MNQRLHLSSARRWKLAQKLLLSCFFAIVHKRDTAHMVFVYVSAVECKSGESTRENERQNFNVTNRLFFTLWV